jgi:hypothetical protein
MRSRDIVHSPNALHGQQVAPLRQQCHPARSGTTAIALSQNGTGADATGAWFAVSGHHGAMKRIVWVLAAAAAVSALAAAGCGSPTSSAPASAAAPSTAAISDSDVNLPSAGTSTLVPSSPSASPSAAASLAPDTTVWLCRPGIANNPCEGSLDATVIDASGASTVEPASPAEDPPIDCFYVYPTVSRQKTVNATLAIDPEIRAVAVAQAARFSQVCRVYAPVYPQLTQWVLTSPASITLASALKAYNGVATAWASYLAHYNDGRGVVLIGHSQGAFTLSMLVRQKIENDPAVLERLVSALLLGGNVTVPVGKAVGGTFSKVPACASASQTGCVVAYSTFDRTPPADAVFGRVTSVLNVFAGINKGSLQVLCVNPAAPSGGTAELDPYIPTTGLSLLVGQAVKPPTAATPFVGYPGQYTAHCETADGATWLQVDAVGGSNLLKSALPSMNPTWGLHAADVNIALGNLVNLVGAEAAAFR